MEKIQKETAGEKLSSFMIKNRKIIITLWLALVLGVVAVCVFIGVNQKSIKKSISIIEEIEYALTNDSNALTEDELKERKENAKEKLAPYLTKGGIVGARANLLAADLAFSEKDFEKAKNHWEKSASSAKGSYLSPLSFFNLGVCYEELNDLEKAVSSYAKAANNEDFFLTTHAKFSEGRVYESLNDLENAKKAYQKLVDSAANDSWTNLAKTRLIALELQEKGE